MVFVAQNVKIIILNRRKNIAYFFYEFCDKIHLLWQRNQLFYRTVFPAR